MTTEPYMPELLPCPFCGQKDLSDKDGDKMLSHNGNGVIECENCGASGPFGQGSKNKGKALWNTRAAPQPAGTIEAKVFGNEIAVYMVSDSGATLLGVIDLNQKDVVDWHMDLPAITQAPTDGESLKREVCEKYVTYFDEVNPVLRDRADVDGYV